MQLHQNNIQTSLWTEKIPEEQGTEYLLVGLEASEGPSRAALEISLSDPLDTLYLSIRYGFNTPE